MKPSSITQATRQDAPAIAVMARKIWSEHYTPVIGKAQVDYMLVKFQSPEAISEQINNGYEYYLVRQNGQNVGYFALVPCKAGNRAQLSKIYVSANARRTGIGQAQSLFTEKTASPVPANSCRISATASSWMIM